MRVRKMSPKECARIKSACERGYVDCFESLCPFQSAMSCILAQGDNYNRPIEKEWTGAHLWVSEMGEILCPTGVKVDTAFPTSRETSMKMEARTKNFLESYS